MRLLLINPNISDSVTTLIEAEARRSASPETQITMQTAAFGVAYIETRFEALIGAYATAGASWGSQPVSSGNFSTFFASGLGSIVY